MLTQVFPIEGCSTEVIDQAGDIPKAHVNTLSCEWVDSVGCIPKDKAEFRRGLQQPSGREAALLCYHLTQ